MDVAGCGQSTREHGWSLSEVGKACGENVRFQGDPTKLAKVRGKLSAIPSRHLSPLPPYFISLGFS